MSRDSVTVLKVTLKNAQKKRVFLRLFSYLFYSFTKYSIKSIKTIKAGSNNKSN